MRQSPVRATALSLSKTKTVLACGALILSIAIAALLTVPACNETRREQIPFVLQIAVLAGMLGGMGLYRIIQVTTRQRHSALDASPIIAGHVNRLWYERAQAIAQFGTYEIRKALDSRKETNAWSPEMYRIVGRAAAAGPMSADEYIDHYVHPDDRDNLRILLYKAFHDVESTISEYRVVGEDGTVRFIYDHLEFVALENGERIFLGQAFDVTERKLAQQELERSHDALKKLVAAIDEHREEEQKRLAREMHDDLGQLLAAIKMDLADLQQCLPGDNAKLLNRLGGLHELVESMTTSVRRIIADLPPKVLEDVGLFNAIGHLVTNFRKRFNIACHLNLPIHEIAIEQKTATAMYRMVQEALNNVAKHACATDVMVSIDLQADRLRLCIVDNGQGMAANAQRKPGSFGLFGIRERAAAMGGEVRIESAPGAGTMLQITVPPPMPQHAEQSGDRHVSMMPI